MTDHEILLKVLIHTEKMNDELNGVLTQLAVLNNRVEMLEQWFWIFAGVVATAVIASIWNWNRHSNLKREIENGRKR